jgi:hypothetical protein
MTFIIEGLNPAPYSKYFQMSETELATANATMMTADNHSGYPCRAALDHAEPGERLLLINYEHLPENSPYRASHAIFIRENAHAAAHYKNEIPDPIATRQISLRAFDANHMMIDAALIDGGDTKQTLETQFANPDVSYIHLHYATRGCFAGMATRA